MEWCDQFNSLPASTPCVRAGAKPIRQLGIETKKVQYSLSTDIETDIDMLSTVCSRCTESMRLMSRWQRSNVIWRTTLCTRLPIDRYSVCTAIPSGHDRAGLFRVPRCNLDHDKGTFPEGDARWFECVLAMCLLS